MLIDRRQSRLLVVDLQEKLMPAIHDGENLLNNCRWMVQVANTMDVPVLASEQYPKGLGPQWSPSGRCSETKPSWKNTIFPVYPMTAAATRY